MNKMKEEQKNFPEDDLINGKMTNPSEESSASSGERGDNTDNLADGCEALQKKYDDLNDSHLRLMAEFDNYRKRTLREKAELIKSGGETTLINLLPIIDDFERAMQNIRVAEDVKAVSEGVDLIYNKFMGYLAQQGVKPIEAIGKTFDTEAFEAVATIPAPEEDLKGKVLDCVQTGYTLHEKVIRHSKVVVGE